MEKLFILQNRWISMLHFNRWLVFQVSIQLWMRLKMAYVTTLYLKHLKGVFALKPEQSVP